MKKLSFLLISVLLISRASAQHTDSVFIAKIFETALTQAQCYQTLGQLTSQIGHRLSGSPQAAQSVEFMKKVMEQNGFDSVWLQPCYVPHWVRGEKEVMYAESKTGKINLSVCALGNSQGTGKKGITAPVIEVKDFQQLDSLGRNGVEGKIVFYNHPFNDAYHSQGQAYGQAVGYRWAGPSRAAKYGAVATITRSMTSSLDDYPHTGSMSYNDSFPKIPAMAISTLGAHTLSKLIKSENGLRVFIRNTSEMLPDSVLSYNVIGEWRGSKTPDKIISVGGHLDSWDVGTGAHDDGAGCVQSVEVLRIFKLLGLRPNNTIRAVLWMNEENGLRGARMYAAEAKRKKENHLFAVESDAGGFVPRGFSFSGDTAMIEKIQGWKKLFEPYQVHEFEFGGTGADLGPLEEYCKVLCGFRPDGQRYFNHHHAANDVFEHVNKRELELGAAAMAALIYLVDKNF
jgi:hypothetical protein